LIILDENILDAQRLLLEASRIAGVAVWYPRSRIALHTVWNRPT
jgi:hypothetical protein